ncbi:Cwf15/Cwc15 cell cycle control protein [Blastocystis hominis]|uniref:Cwf15/Cwc15 cell cycle control protein n=1 Tax=Blastocystis hominis TaxID=12968 RepID=D8LXN6_BLAHO|nr:Cwf15/Cwc15 cell cycle control protein [Blastocystis hominis]CBK20341.2 Cwf15/Cwc15 cell cycle control protein [Blastocystis hominis]|eukprot:XP_012894389.1 Cwf15/Cwc15 cell cycle control protein [Blastocystis hominis]
MSTAHKPTWTPAAGRGTGNGAISSSGYLTGGGRWARSLKCRQFEYALLGKGSSRTFEVENEVVIPEVKPPQDIKPKEKEDEVKKELPVVLQKPEPKVNDDFGDFDDSDESDSEESSSESDSEDDTALLMKELERVKKEKELAKQKEEEEKAQMEAALNREEMIHSNPLLFNTGDTLKRRWDDDVVFRNQGKTEKRPKRFINDTIRNDFHVNFMNTVFRQ